MILYSEGSTAHLKHDADAVLAVLCAAYPGHPWAVRCDGGVIFIRHLQYGFNWGMNIKFKDVSHDAAVMKKKIIFMAGEWLERAGLARGRATDDEILRVDGVPEEYQPHPSDPKPIDVEKIAAEPARETPRPQVEKAH